MPQIIYDVAVTLDGYIAGPDGDISRFPAQGAILDDYLARLQGYSTAIMGRATYEFGYAYGMEPGANPYPHMKTLVFSEAIDLPPDAEVSVIRGDALPVVERLRTEAPGDIYLCGGGRFAGALLAAGLIDRLRLKRAPVLYGGGTPLFSGCAKPPALTHLNVTDYGNGSRFEEFALRPCDDSRD